MSCLNVDISLKSPILSVSGALASAPIKASASLLCYITAQTWEEFLVAEGVLNTEEDGAYKVKVIKRHY